MSDTAILHTVLIFYHRAIIPGLLRFAYTSPADLRIHSDSLPGTSKKFAEDVYDSAGNGYNDEEHVLVLDFVEQKKTKKSDL